MVKREIEKLKDISDVDYFVIFAALVRYQSALQRGLGDNKDSESVDRLIKVMCR